MAHTIIFDTLFNDNKCFHEVFYKLEKPPKKLQDKIRLDLGHQFELDSFQVRAQHVIDNFESIMVTAHTSAGKTIIAEYIIALCMKSNFRCFYTTPIKALSNQKYNEFKEKYKKIGLLTGDVNINPGASLVIMTAEVLKEMVISNPYALDKLTYVIIDEGHFLANEERGRVWEETIIHFQKTAKLAILSATLPNYPQFAKWIVNIKEEPLHVVGTTERPVPLEFCFHCPSNGLVYQLKKGKSNVDKDLVKYVMDQCGGKFRGKNELLDLLENMKHSNRLPVVIYCPARKTCDSMSHLISSLNFLKESEKEIYKKAFDRILQFEDENMKSAKCEIEMYKDRMLKGIAVHHSSLMTFTKEFVEQSFIKGAIKVIFSTETLSIGLNMPARSVIFTSIYKYDGKVKRRYTKSEFIQMADRAGRRGLDPQGHVIFSLSENLNENEIITLLNSTSEDLKSQLKFTYHDVLYYANNKNLSELKRTLNRSFLKFTIGNVQSEIAMCDKMTNLLVEQNFLDNKLNITTKGLIALSAKFYSNYLIIAELIHRNVFKSMNHKNIVEIFAMLQKIDEPGSEDMNLYSEYQNMVDQMAKNLYDCERKFNIIKKDLPYRSPITKSYINAMKQIYEEMPLHEVASKNNIYMGVLAKRIKEMRKLFEKISENRRLDETHRKTFFDIASKLKLIERFNISMMKHS